MLDKIIMTKKDIMRQQATPEKPLGLPGSSGIIIFCREDELLFVIRSRNIGNLFVRLFGKSEHQKPEKIVKILDEYDTIECITTENSFEALIAEKKLISDKKPKYQDTVRLYDNYAYLALQTEQSPYITIQEDTAGEDTYIGPFKNKFFLIDIIELFGDLADTPACKPYMLDSASRSSALYQLENLNREECRRKRVNGQPEPKAAEDYLSKLKSLSRKELDINDPAYKKCPAYCEWNSNKELARLFDKVYLNKDEQLLAVLDEIHNHLYEELYFEKADAVKKKRALLERYYNCLTFFKTIKRQEHTLVRNGEGYRIKNGLIKEIYRHEERRHKDKLTGSKPDYSFDAGEAIYGKMRDNESLAVAKEHLDEMLTVYEIIGVGC